MRKTKIVVYAKDYRGLHATVDATSGEPLLTIPMKVPISYKDLLRTELGKQLREKNVFSGHWMTYIFPLIYVLEEQLKPDSVLRPWLDVIPLRAGEHPMFFSAEEQKWLQASSTLGKQECESGRRAAADRQEDD